MPVIATPVFGASPGPAAGCSSQSILAATTTTQFGCAMPARMKAMSAMQGQTATITWTVVDADGKPVDLSTCGTFDPDDETTGVVRLIGREPVVLPNYPCDPSLDVVGTVDDPTTGVVTFPATDITARAGVYLVNVGVFNGDGELQLVNETHIVVNRSLFNSTEQVSGMPTIAEIRLQMRDSDPGDNPLLDAVQFDLAEIVACLESPILYWNESQPPIPQVYTTTTFPHRFHWTEGVIARLYLIAAHYYRRNKLPYQAGGVQVDDLNKDGDYEQIGQQKWAEYKQWVLMKKVQLNAEACIQSTLSPYSYMGSW